jgi:hypothetical protein
MSMSDPLTLGEFLALLRRVPPDRHINSCSDLADALQHVAAFTAPPRPEGVPITYTVSKGASVMPDWVSRIRCAWHAVRP